MNDKILELEAKLKASDSGASKIKELETENLKLKRMGEEEKQAKLRQSYVYNEKSTNVSSQQQEKLQEYINR